MRESDTGLAAPLGFVDFQALEHRLWKTCTKSILGAKSQMSIRLSGEAGFPTETSAIDSAIEKNWGEIGKKCWTRVRGNLTLESDRQRGAAWGIRPHSFHPSTDRKTLELPVD